MRYTKNRRGLVAIFFMALFLAVTVPTTGFGQGRGHNRGGNVNDWKCGKFVNCHDARNGRLDGRGPRNGVGSNPRRWRNDRLSNNNDRQRSVRSRHWRQDYVRTVRLRDNRWRRN